MSRVSIFAKGNLDVRDTLHALKLGDRLVWNGINEILRARTPASLVRVRHETWSRSDALLEADGTIPPALAGRELPLGAYPLSSQYSPALFETDADAIVLSIQPDANTNMLRHCRDGFLFNPSDLRSWSGQDLAWLRESFIDTGLIDLDVSMANFARIIARIRERSDAAILIYNLSSVVPGEQIHAHDGMEEIFSTRIRRFNLGLIELSQQTGISIVDVDTIVARAGADRMKYDALHLTGEGCRAVAQEVVRVLDDLGVLPSAEAGGVSLSVVIRSKDEADRLRLTLTSLARQSQAAEVVVVDDGSSDHTGAVLDEAAGWLPLTVVRHATPRGRSGASNAGARAASGQALLFLDGDTLADPDLVRRHAAAHAARSDLIGRGETFHLRCTRFLQDPEAATPRPGEVGRLERLSPAERERLRVTRAQILGDFDAVARRAEAGIYPGAGPRRLQELELDALRHHPDCSVLWAASSGANQSVPRAAFLEVGGFDEAIDNNEHRELALRLCRAGLRMAPAEGARTYHLTHRSGWRDPLQETGWEAVFYAAHPIPEVKLLAVFWASLSPQSPLPAQARIGSLPALEAAACGGNGVDYDAARTSLGLPALGAGGRR